MSGSGFATAAADMGALHERISAATAVLTNFEFPGEGKVERAFGSVQASLTADAEAAGQYANDAALACSTQDSIDHGLEFAPTSRDLEELFVAQTSGDPEAKAKFDAAAEDYKQARIAHENSTLGNCFPPSVTGTGAGSTGSPKQGKAAATTMTATSAGWTAKATRTKTSPSPCPRARRAAPPSPCPRAVRASP
ncbi:hypothetical protein [Mycobacteroides abscessus]